MSIFSKWSEFDVAAHNAKAKKLKAELHGEGCSDESKLHEQIRQEIQSRGWIGFHGSMAHKTKRTLGEPDFCCLMDNGRILFVECKTKGGKLSTDQLGMMAWMEKLGHKLHIVRSLSDFMRLINP